MHAGGCLAECMTLSSYLINISFLFLSLNMSQHLMFIPRKINKNRNVILSVTSEHMALECWGWFTVFPSLPVVCLWFWQPHFTWEVGGEGTQRLLHTQEPKVTQPLVNNVVCGVCEGTGVLLLREKGRWWRAIFKHLKGCLLEECLIFVKSYRKSDFSSV